MNITELIVSLATKAGLKKDDPAIVDLLTATELTKVTVKPDLENALEKNLFNVEAAKANSAVAAYFKSQTLDPIDQWLKNAMDEFKFDDAAKAEINGEQSSYKRVDIFSKKLNDIASKSAKGSGDNKELVEKINALNAEIATVKKAASDKEASILAQNESELTDLLMENHLSTYKLAGGEIPMALKITAAKEAIKTALQTKSGVVKREGKLLTLSGKEGAKFFNEKNQEQTFNDFVASTLAANNLLVTGDPNPPAPPAPGPGVKIDTVNVNHDALAQLESQMAQIGVKP